MTFSQTLNSINNKLWKKVHEHLGTSEKVLRKGYKNILKRFNESYNKSPTAVIERKRAVTRAYRRKKGEPLTKEIEESLKAYEQKNAQPIEEEPEALKLYWAAHYLLNDYVKDNPLDILRKTHPVSKST